MEENIILIFMDSCFFTLNRKENKGLCVICFELGCQVKLSRTKSRAFVPKCGQNISSSVWGTKSRAFVPKSGKNCANLLYDNSISWALPENHKKGGDCICTLTLNTLMIRTSHTSLHSDWSEQTCHASFLFILWISIL